MSPESIPHFEHLRNGELRARLISIRVAAKEILKIGLMRYFTDHSVTHSDRLTAVVDQFIAPVQGLNSRLSDQELFVLYAACYLHDIGMHYDRAGDTGAVGKALAGLGGENRSADRVGSMAWDDPRPETQFDLLRKYHHLISGEMVLSSVNAESPPVGMQLTHEDGSEYIASICEAHGLNLDAEEDARRYAEITQDRGSLRVGLLAAILRIADILDESQRRANPRERRTLALDVEAKTHWFRHHYTEFITFDQSERTITIWFDFSEENHALYSPVIPKLQLPQIQAELNRHMRLLNRYGLVWVLVSRDDPKHVTTADPVPEDVLEAMRTKVEANAGVVMQEATAADLFLEKYDGVKERLVELWSREDSMPTALYLRELGAIAADLWRAGGNRSAWNLLNLPFDQGKASLKPGEQLEMGCLLARTMENDQPGWACQTLMGLTPIADHLGADNPQKAAYWCLRASCMFNAYVEEFAEAARRALALTTSADARRELWSSLCEWYLLQGRLDEAMQTLQEVREAGEELPVRAALVECRIRAVRGDAKGAEDALSAAANSAEAVPERMSLAMLHAELLHLSFRDEEAASILRESVAPTMSGIAEDRAFAAADNQAMVSLHLVEARSSHDFYALVDVRRLAGFELWDTSAVIRGRGAAEKGEHYEALPVFWRLIVGTHRLGCWRSYQWASDLMARECIEIASMRPEPSWVSEAVFHALGSDSEKLADMIGKRLMEWGDARRIATVVAACLQYGNLPRHAQLAARILAEIADAIPDEQVAPVVDWLLARCPASAGGLIGGTGSLFSSIWQALRSVGCRMTPDLAWRVVSAAVGHEEWKRRSAFRGKLVSTVTECLPALAPEHLPQLTDRTTPLAVDADLRFDHDYADVVNLLYQLARLAGPQVRDAIAGSLYPADGGPVNALLIQAAPLLGKKLRDDDRIREWAREIAAQIRLQVQRAAPGQRPQEVRGSLGTVAQRSDGGTVQVSVGGHSQGLRALMQYRHILGGDELQELVSAILDMAGHPENLLANRESLLYDLAGFADCLPDDLADIVFSRLSGIAMGAVAVQGVASTDAGNPLNPFKMNMGTADDVRGMALYTLSCVVKAMPNEHRLDQTNDLLAHALTASSNRVRRMGAVAARIVPRLSPSVFYDLLLATRDHDARVAASSMYAFAGEGGLQMDEGQCHSLAYSILMAAKSPDRELRRAAAYALARSESWFSSCSGNGNPNLEEAKSILASDACFSVRSVFTS